MDLWFTSRFPFSVNQITFLCGFIVYPIFVSSLFTSLKALKIPTQRKGNVNEYEGYE